MDLIGRYEPLQSHAKQISPSPPRLRLILISTLRNIKTFHNMTSRTSDAPDVVSLYRACTKSFNVLFESLEENQSKAISPRIIQDEQGRFRIWAENSGAHRDRGSPMSLDHRLREASEIKRTVINLLDALNDALNDGQQLQ
jgi:hypothetical protein